MTSRILIMKGLPGSGKSTYCKFMVRKHPGIYKIIGRDFLRFMLDIGVYSERGEEFIREAELHLAELALFYEYIPLIDDCNLSPSSQAMWSQFARDMKVELIIKDLTDVPLQKCIERDKKRTNQVGEHLIRKMHKDFLE